ncbi:MAG TPA: hypothetical protein DCP90_02205 [Clostridiales bacterium]|nr:MAG: hypothetical protein A2Y22_00420 [Clostridiales bacterium GWD2_32_59]HAN09407.1 hypothetical protein [Clostridiales bacterium]
MYNKKIITFLIMVVGLILMSELKVHATDYSYVEGTQASISLSAGTYIIEVWGSEGASGNDEGGAYGGVGGKGGYARGVLTLDSLTNLYINGSSGTIEVRKDANNIGNRILAGGVGGRGDDAYYYEDPEYWEYTGWFDGAPGSKGIGNVYGYAPLTNTLTSPGIGNGVGFTRITALSTTSTITELSVGQIIMFHGEAWKLINPSTGLIVKAVSIGNMAFDPDNNRTYNSSDSNNIGYYLNNTYYNTFTVGEKSLIRDGIYLLTENEYNSAILAGVFPSSGDGTNWWLITPHPTLVQCVFYVKINGLVDYTATSGSAGVRPALRIQESTIVNLVPGGGYEIVQDNTSPTCVITSSVESPSNASSITYTFTFNETVTGFDINDVTVTNGTKGTFSGSGSVYTLVVTNSGSGTQTIIVNAAVCSDAAGNGNTSDTKQITIDSTPPEVPDIDVNISTPTNTDVTVTITYPNDATIKEYKIGSGAWISYIVALTITTNSTVYARCYDDVGNPSTQSSLSIVNIDKIAPGAPTVDKVTGIYNSTQTITVTDAGGIDVAHTYYTIDGTEPDNTDTEVIGTIPVDGNNGVTVILKLVSYDAAGNIGVVTTEEYTFDKTGPTITPDITSRIKDGSDISVEITLTADSGIDSWEYEWSESATPTGSWTAGVTDTQTLTQTANGTWYLHIRATDNDANEIIQRYGIYKKGSVQVSEGYTEGTEKQDRKNFRYYIGKDNNGINKIMLVAGNHGGSVAQTFEKDDVIDIDNKFKNGMFYIDRDGKIQQY